MINTTTIPQTGKPPAPPAAVYATLTDSQRDAAFAGSPARMPKRTGAGMRASGAY